MPSLSIACVTVARIGYDRPLMVTRSKATVIDPFRSMWPALVTALTTPRMTEPAGTSTWLFSSRRSTSVVASNLSSTCAVPELSEFCSRTSNSVPTGNSSGFWIYTVPAGADGSIDRESLERASVDRVPGVEYEPVASPRARMRMFSI